MLDLTLTAAGVKHELVTFSGLDHRLVDPAARTEVLRRSDEFLRAALGPDVPREH
jgi:dipeptidyl aminopeptidase/acylaminoacyl peptidase